MYSKGLRYSGRRLEETVILSIIIADRSATESSKFSAEPPTIHRLAEHETSAANRLTPIIRQKAPGESPPLVPPTPKPRGLPWLSSAIVFVLAAVGTISFFYVKGVQAGTEITVPRFLRGLLPGSGLGLRVEGQGDRLLVRWNRRSSIARSATDGILQIDDGFQRRRVYLDSEQIADGSVLYRPASDDVTFRLEVHGEQGAIAAESMRVLDGTKTPLANAAALKPESDAAAKSPVAASAIDPRESKTMVDVKAPEHEVFQNPPNLVSQGAEPAGTASPTQLDSNRSAFPVSPPAVTAPPLETARTSVPASASKSLPAPVTTRPLSQTPALPPPALESALKLSNWDEAPSGKQFSRAPPLASTTAESAKALSVYSPARPLKKVLPDTRFFGPLTIYRVTQVEVHVNIDAIGRVTDVHILKNRRKIGEAVAGAALIAAKQWTFEPATVQRKPVASEHTIIFEFRPSRGE